MRVSRESRVNHLACACEVIRFKTQAIKISTSIISQCPTLKCLLCSPSTALPLSPSPAECLLYLNRQFSSCFSFRQLQLLGQSIHLIQRLFLPPPIRYWQLLSCKFSFRLSTLLSPPLSLSLSRWALSWELLFFIICKLHKIYFTHNFNVKLVCSNGCTSREKKEKHKRPAQIFLLLLLLVFSSFLLLYSFFIFLFLVFPSCSLFLFYFSFFFFVLRLRLENFNLHNKWKCIEKWQWQRQLLLLR